MKRSEALDLIVGKLPTNPNSVEAYELADSILKTLESIGMYPPINEQNYCHHDNDDRKVVNNAVYFFTWESENET
jgi:hypothetical protein